MLSVSNFNVHAGPIGSDLEDYVTVDSNTNFGWLAWTYTVDNSYEQILERIRDENDVLYGFNYATTNDFSNLVSSFGLTIGKDYQGTNTNIDVLFDMFGITNYGSTTNQSFGITKARGNESPVLSLTKRFSNENYEVQTSYGNDFGVTSARDTFGHALYKDMTPVAPAANSTEVPEPASFAMFAFALVALLTRKK